MGGDAKKGGDTTRGGGTTKSRGIVEGGGSTKGGDTTKLDPVWDDMNKYVKSHLGSQHRTTS
jgi:hypothetical protein